MLGLVSQSMGPCIGKGIHSMIQVHLALTPSDESGTPGVAPGMLILYHHAVTDLKFGRDLYLDAVPTPCSKTGFHPVQSPLRVP